MRYYLSIIVFLFTLSINAQVSDTVQRYERCKFLEESIYIVNENSIYFENCAIHRRVDADPNSFVGLSKGLAYDNENVFFNGIKLNIKPNYLRVILSLYKDIYWINGSYLYHNNQRKTKIDTVSFKNINQEYFKDKNHVYYEGNVVEGIDNKTIVSGGSSYSSYIYDEHFLFLQGKKLEGYTPINSFFCTKNDKVYEYDISLLPKERSDISVENIQAIPQTKYGIINDTLYYNQYASPYHHINTEKLKVYTHDIIVYEDQIIYKGDPVENLDIPSFEIIEDHSSYPIVKYKNGLYELYFRGTKVLAKQIKQKPNYSHHDPFQERHFKKVEVKNSQIFINSYLLVSKQLLFNNGIENIQSTELVSIKKGYRRGCGMDKQWPSDFYILKIDGSYWQVMVSENTIIEYIGSTYLF